MKLKWVFFAISLLVILPGLVSLILFGLRPSIDFTGGTMVEIKTEIDAKDKIVKIFADEKIDVASVSQTGAGTYLLRTKAIDNSQKDRLAADLQKELKGAEITKFETVGPVIGKELTMKALQSVGIASIAIILYIAYAFRTIPKPYSSWKFGVSAVIALLHDVLVVVGIFSLLGHFANVEVDSLFVTALLTVIGFSVHDTIVVFDRIRENLSRMPGKTLFSDVVNVSIWQTLGRSLMTSLTVLFTLLALILFGGESIRWFVVALFIGVFSGTYSSIFNAAPLLVLWEKKSK